MDKLTPDEIRAVERAAHAMMDFEATLGTIGHRNVAGTSEGTAADIVDAAVPGKGREVERRRTMLARLAIERAEELRGGKPRGPADVRRGRTRAREWAA